MKWKISLALALALNVLIAFIAWSQSQHRPHMAPEVEIVRIEAPSIQTRTQIIMETNVIVSPFHWSQIETDDYTRYVANLRAIGCPPGTIRDILEADLNVVFDARARDLADGPSRQFWELMLRKDRFEKLIEEKHNQLKALDEERSELLKSLLGTDTPADTVP